MHCLKILSKNINPNVVQKTSLLGTANIHCYFQVKRGRGCGYKNYTPVGDDKKMTNACTVKERFGTKWRVKGISIYILEGKYEYKVLDRSMQVMCIHYWKNRTQLQALVNNDSHMIPEYWVEIWGGAVNLVTGLSSSIHPKRVVSISTIRASERGTIFRWRVSLF